jgi:hypothetical protein
MNILDFLTMMQTSLFAKGLDTTVSIGSKVTLEIEDVESSKTVAVITGDTLEEAYANLLGAMSGAVRDTKTGRYQGLSRL